MKKKKNNILFFVLLIAISLCLTACAEKTVDITVPAAIVSDMTNEEILSAAEEQGFEKCLINDDGTVTYTMTETKQSEMLSSLKDSLDESIESLINGEDKIESFIDIKYNDNISQVDIYVDSNLYSTWDALAGMGFMMIGNYYQIFDGTPMDSTDVIVNYIDNDSNEIIFSQSLANMRD